MSRSKSSVRQEAGVLGWHQLTGDQRQAAAAIAEQLHGLVISAEQRHGLGRTPSSPRSPHEWSFLPVIDRARGNHVFLIDGERGSGKSTVLVTLLDVWGRRARRQDLQDGEKHLCPWQGPAVVPVGLLDLQPMAPTTNLLLHVIGALKRVVEVLAARDTGGRVASDGWELPKEIPSQVAWRKFVKAAVAAGQGTPSALRSMDLEEQVAEMEHRERERLDLPRAFTDLVDALHGDMRAWLQQQELQPPEGMLFVLAIDDADMNPHKSVELLELLRTLWHPNLAYVLTGDTALFRSLIELDLASASGRPGTQTEGALRQLIGMTTDILDKVIPRRQRFRLRELPFDARPGALASALRKQGCEDDHAAPLLAHVHANPWLRPLIPGYLRQIADLAQALARLTDARDQMCAVFTDVIEELDGELPKLGARCTVREEAGKLIIDLGLQHTVWTFRGERQQSVELRDRPMTRARVAIGLSADITLDEQNALAAGDRYGAAALLGWRLAHESPAEYTMQGARPRIAQDPVVTLMPRAGFFQEGDSPPTWRFPDWPDGWHHVRACAFWDATASQVNPDDSARLDRLAVCYLASVLAGAGIDVADLDLAGEPPWDRLAEEIAALAVGAGPAADWAIKEAPLLAAPESALSPAAAEDWLKALSGTFERREIAWRDKCLRRRRSRLLPRPPEAAGMKEEPDRIKEALQQIDSRYMDYAFRAILAREISPALQLVLEHVPVRFGGRLVEQRPTWPLQGRMKPWEDLSDLISPERKKQLLSLPWPKQRELADSIDLNQKVEIGTAQGMVHQLWKMADAAAGHQLEHLITLEDNALRILVEPPSPESGNDVIDIESPGKPRLRLSTVQVPEYRELAPATNERVYPAMDAVLRLAIDVVADEADADGLMLTQADAFDLQQHVALRGMEIWWPFRLDTPYGALHLPVPQWMARIDWEILIQCWNRTVAQLQQRQSEERRFTHVNIDGFIAWYIKLIVAIHLNRQSAKFHDWSRDPWKEVELSNQFVNPVDDYNNVRVSESGKLYYPRNAAHHDWLCTIPAVLAPEFGLHDEVARTVLKTFEGKFFPRRPRAGINELTHIEYLQRARRTLWLLSGKPDGEIDSTLRRIDEDHPQHPWLVVMRASAEQHG